MKIHYERVSGNIMFGKYILKDLSYVHRVKDLPRYSGEIKNATIDNGDLTMYYGFKWDGPSFLTIDTPDFMRGSMVHDCMYRMMRESVLPTSCRKFADKQLYKCCREDGMSFFRAQYVYWAVRIGARKMAQPE